MMMRIIFASILLLLFAPACAMADWFVSGAGANSVLRFDDDGNFLGNFVSPGSGGLGDPQGIAFGPDGNLYVASNGSDNVLRFDGLTGAFIDVFAEDSRITWPAEINFRGDHLYVSNFAQPTGGVFRFDATTGNLSDLFASPARLADGQSWDANGDLYVSSANTVLKFNGVTGISMGNFVTPGDGGLALALDNLFLADGTLLVADFNTNSVKNFDVDGTFLGNAISGLPGPQGLEFGPNGLLHAGSFTTGVINRFNPVSLQFIDAFMTASGTTTNNFVYRSNELTATVDTFVVTRGILSSGGLAELELSDNVDLSARRDSTGIQSVVELEIKGVSPSAMPSSFEFVLEASVFARSTVNQTIWLYDYAAQSFEQVDTRQAQRLTDLVTTVTAEGDLSRFVEPVTACVKAKVLFQSINPRQQFAANIDQIVWRVE